jgi:hypothetical protein
VFLLSSREGDGKSTLAGSAAAKVSSGAEWLGAPTVRGLVLFLSLEEHQRETLRCLTVHGADLRHVILAGPTDQPLATLEKAAAQLSPVLVIVDSLAALAAAEGIKEAGSSAQWSPLMMRLVTIARKTGAAVLILAHSKKGREDYRDSTAIGAAVDVVALLQPPQKGEGSTVRHIEYRKRRLPLEDLTIEFRGDGFELVGGEATTADRIRAFVAEHPGCSTRMIRNGLPGRSAEKDAALAALLASGAVVDRGVGKNRALHVGTVGARLGHTPGHGGVPDAKTQRGTGRARSGHGVGHTPAPAPPVGGELGHGAGGANV